MLFYLGTHEPAWLHRSRIPLFVSRRRLARRQSWRPARTRWAIDSGGFTELSMFGTWQTSAEQYAREVTRWHREIGRLDWAAVQDWMCEPFILAKTGLTVFEHQTRTILSFVELQRLAPAMPWMPVLQGWNRDDYERHADQYEYFGIQLAAQPIVGVGSICRRQATDEAAAIIRAIAARGIRPHAFGFKTQGIRACGAELASADSMAWSFQARRRARMPGCTHHFCANCLRYALRWRRRMLARAD